MSRRMKLGVALVIVVAGLVLIGVGITYVGAYMACAPDCHGANDPHYTGR